MLKNLADLHNSADTQGINSSWNYFLILINKLFSPILFLVDVHLVPRLQEF